VYKPISERE